MVDDPTPERPKRLLRLRLLLQASAVAVVALLLVLLVQRTLEKGAGAHLVSDVKAGTRPFAPEFELAVIWPRAETWPTELRRALADERVSPRELRGYPVVMNFWASWCAPCKSEAPRLNASAKAYAGRVVFLGVDVQDFESDALRFLERYETNYVSVRDGGDSTYGAYGLTGLPETYFLDREGRVIAHSLGEISEAELEAGIAAAIEGRARAE
jgi:cytochrome c biogenesis protein CcmG, thiol:disulfide interchange protein DsbE